ncbi:MAG: putative inorganic carbon transporter subunit DabA, partial [Polyangiaceae bacterium]
MPRTEPPSSRIRAALSHAAHLLPAQAPLEVFVHHNTLHAFQHADFHDALEQARSRLGAEGYWSEERYREALARGRIQGPDLTAAIERLWLPELGDMPPGLPSTASLATLALTHGVAPESPAGLRWRLSELRAGERFHDGVARAARDRILAAAPGDEPLVVAELWQACQAVARRAPVAAEASAAPAPPASLRDRVLLVSAEDPDELVNPVLINLAGAFLDRGQSRWSMPDRDEGFFAASCRVLGAGRAVRPVWLRGLGDKVRRWTAEGKRAEAVVE